MSKTDELKKLQEEQKKLREKQKKLREELDAGKEQRIEARKTMADVRKKIIPLKTDIRKAQAEIYDLFKDGEGDKIDALADNLMSKTEQVVELMKEFALACDTINDL